MNYSDLVVIGAGVSGLVVATQMTRAGYTVAVLEKARGSGGRISSKRIEMAGVAAVTVDLGCPDFSAHSDAFKRQLDAFGEVVGRVNGAANDRYCGVPRNSMLTRQMADSLAVHFSHRVTTVEPSARGWMVTTEDADNTVDHWECERLVIAVPAEQSAALVPPEHAAQRHLGSSTTEPQWVVALALETREGCAILQRLSGHPDISKVSVENSKLGRDYPAGLLVCVIHYSPAWTRRALGWTKAQVQAYAIKCLRGVWPVEPKLRGVHVHRWLYSLPTAHARSQQTNTSGETMSHYLDDSGLALCGDYWAGDQYEGVERAWHSATALAVAMRADRSEITGASRASQRNNAVEIEGGGYGGI